MAINAHPPLLYNLYELHVITLLYVESFQLATKLQASLSQVASDLPFNGWICLILLQGCYKWNLWKFLKTELESIDLVGSFRVFWHVLVLFRFQILSFVLTNPESHGV